MKLHGSVSLARLGFLGSLLGSLLLGGSYVTAQYSNHHQQWLDDGNLYDRSDTKALTPVDEFLPKLKWAFASTVKRDDPPSPNLITGVVQDQIATLLVKLNENVPNANPFEFIWSREYYAWLEENKDVTINLDVEDVYYENEEDGYVLCGSATVNPNDPDLSRTSGFILRVNVDGTDVIKARIYPINPDEEPAIGVRSFKSVVPWHNGEGYIAVGETHPINSPTEVKGPSAAYVSVDKALKVKCGRRFDGSFNRSPFFANPNVARKSSRFNKVIQYQHGNPSDPDDFFQGFAVVGDSDLYNNPLLPQCPASLEVQERDIIVITSDRKCKLECKIQHGHNEIVPDEGIWHESGLSIAQIKEGKEGLIVTGNVKKSFDCQSEFDDILVMRLKNKCKLKWWRRFDVRQAPDRGTAVQMKSKGKRILIAGETNTDYLSNGLTSFTKDAFIMDLSTSSGSVNRLDVFGNIFGTENGALAPGNVDLHLTNDDPQSDPVNGQPDSNAVLMGNTQIPATSSGRSYPYLVERYESILPSSANLCVHRNVPAAKFKSKFKFQKVSNKKFKPEDPKIYVEPLKMELKNQQTCKKGIAPIPSF